MTAYRDRPAGSVSKLNTCRDGTRILRTIIILVTEEQPLAFFFCIGLVLWVGGVSARVPVVLDYLRTGVVPRLQVTRGREEFNRLTCPGTTACLAIALPAADKDATLDATAIEALLAHRSTPAPARLRRLSRP